MTTTGTIAAVERNVPFRKRHDLEVAWSPYADGVYPIFKDPTQLTYHRLLPEQAKVLELIDGSNSVTDICHKVQDCFPANHVTEQEVQDIIMYLHSKRLITSTRMGVGAELLRARGKKQLKWMTSTFANPLFMKFPGFDPTSLLQILCPLFGWIFRRTAVVAFSSFIIAAAVFALTKSSVIAQRLPEFSQFFGWPNLAWLWLTLGVAKLLHEFGHGLCCRHFGGECHSMGIMLLLLTPTMYCDVSDSWMLRSKWHRIAIASAGMYVEMILSSVAIIIWWNTSSGLLNHLALNFFFVSMTTTVIFNVNPLMKRFDGYYILSDYLEVPNLYTKSQTLLKQKLASWFTGQPEKENPFAHRSELPLLAYSVCSTIYRTLIMVFILGFLYQLLKPYQMGALGIALTAVVFGKRFYGLGKGLVTLISDAYAKPKRRKRLRWSALAGIGLLAICLFVDVPWRLSAPVYVTPADARTVFNALPGEIVSIDIIPGQQVKTGDVIIRLHDKELEKQHERLIEEVESKRSEIDILNALGRQDERAEAVQMVATLNRELELVQSKILKLTVVAPHAGFIVDADQVTPPETIEQNQTLQQWTGTPLDPNNLGAWLSGPTHICSIAPASESTVTLYVDQEDREFLVVGTECELRFDSESWATQTGVVEGFSSEPLLFVPHVISAKYGGKLPTTTDNTGQERLTSVAYAVRMQPVNGSTLRSDMRGRAVWTVDSHSIGFWFWRWLRSTIQSSI